METTMTAIQSQSPERVDVLFSGTIEHLNYLKGFGFIKADSEGKVYFRHKPVIGQKLSEGDFVVFNKKVDHRFNSECACKIIRAYRSKDGFNVVDRQDSHVHDDLTKMLPAIIAELTCGNQNRVEQEISFPYIIGKTKCVEVSTDDEIVYARRIGRLGSTKFVKGRTCPLSNTVSIVIKKNKSVYEILSCYIGTKSEVEPYDGKATENSFCYWENHALIFGSEPIDTTTISSHCPWPKMPFGKLNNGEF